MIEVRVWLDTNVVCDWLLDREPWRDDASIIAELTTAGSLTCLLSATTVINVFYLARKVVGREAAQTLAAKCMRSFEVWPVDHAALTTALSLPGSDFEDNVQIAVAQIAKAGIIVTRDATGFRQSTIPVVTPSDFLRQLRTP